jgi:hypothetical protein
MAKRKMAAKPVIAILQRGWVFVGMLSRNGSALKLENARNVRRWGTTRGLGELAAEGPKPNTVLDPAGAVEFHELTVVALLNCEESKWIEILK